MLDWQFEIYVTNLGATNSQGIAWRFVNGTATTQGWATAAIDTTADVLVKMTGEVANGADTITQRYWTVYAE